MNYTTIKFWYTKGLWTKKMVALAVKQNVITEEQYKEITGEDYTA